MHVRLLGPVDVTSRGQVVPIAGLRRKAVLAVLALRPHEVVSTDRLIDVVWGERTPATALNSLQSHVSYLRAVLGTRAAIVARPPGYVLELPDPATDVRAAEQLIREAAQARDPGQRAVNLRAALALRRGRPLADLDGLEALDREAASLQRLLLDAEQALVEARLDLGEHAQVLADLERLTELHPMHEHLHGLLMQALYRSGRQADALATYDRLRRVLDEELGIPPGPALRDLHTAVLQQDASLRPPAPDVARVADTSPATTAAPTGVAASVPAQLPRGVAVFSGRRRELAVLDQLVDEALQDGPGGPSGVSIATVSGTPGVGKTALVVHWAHRVAARFPDGQLYVNLRGFDAGGTIVDPGEAVRGFLDALRVPAERIPSGLAEQAALYRTTLAGKRVLVIVDNARDAEQVRPLLPGSAGCVAVVTSRVGLTSLVVTEGARPMDLDLLSVDEARDLMTRRIGAERVEREEEAVDELIARCARLPLALAITAARASTSPGRPLALLADELRDADAALDALHGGDAATDVRAVLSWSYHELSAEAARLLRLLALHPGPSICAPAAGSLAGLPRRQVTRLLAELTRSYLLTEVSTDRYVFHDLLRAYAGELLEETDPRQEQHAARHRMLDYYLRTADAAAVAIHPHFSRVELPPPCPGSNPQAMADRAAAQAWFVAERPTLMAASREAAPAGFPVHAWQLAWAMSGFLERHGHWQDMQVVACAALDVCTAAADPAGEAHIRRDLARACSRLGRHEEAMSEASRAGELFRALGDEAGEAHTHLTTGQILERHGDIRLALQHSLQALQLFGSAGNAPGEAYSLNAVGWQYGLLGDFAHALDFCGRAVIGLHEVGDVSGEADTWDSLGYAHHQLGDFAQAIECYRHAMELFAASTDRFSEATTLDRLGDSHAAAGDTATARDAWGRAVAILDELGHPAADEARSKLAASASRR